MIDFKNIWISGGMQKRKSLEIEPGYDVIDG